MNMGVRLHVKHFFVVGMRHRYRRRRGRNMGGGLQYVSMPY